MTYANNKFWGDWMHILTLGHCNLTFCYVWSVDSWFSLHTYTCPSDWYNWKRDILDEVLCSQSLSWVPGNQRLYTIRYSTPKTYNDDGHLNHLHHYDIAQLSTLKHVVIWGTVAHLSQLMILVSCQCSRYFKIFYRSHQCGEFNVLQILDIQGKFWNGRT